MTKYCTHLSGGTVDNKTVLDPEDDAATANWGSGWRMPTAKEQDELESFCTWKWMINYKGSDVNGYEVERKSSGNSIFLPAAGYRDGTSHIDDGSDGYYWSSSLVGGDYNYSAFSLNFNIATGIFLNWNNYSIHRYLGQNVRAVRVLSE